MLQYELPHSNVHAMHRLPVHGGLLRVLCRPLGGQFQNSLDAVFQHRVTHGEVDVVLTEGVLKKVLAENRLVQPGQKAALGDVYIVGLENLLLGLDALKNFLLVQIIISPFRYFLCFPISPLSPPLSTPAT